MTDPLDIVILGLSLSSSWGNGHATTFRALLRGLHAEGHRVLFLERDVPWYASQRDLPDPDFCKLQLYSDVDRMLAIHGERLRKADAVIIAPMCPMVSRLSTEWPSLARNVSASTTSIRP